MLIPGFSIVARNPKSGLDEIDQIVKNNNGQGVWYNFENRTFIECKNWSKPARAKEIRDFEDKLRNYWLHTGLFFSVKGFTGNARQGAKAQAKLRFMQERFRIVTLDGNDIEEIFNCKDILEKIDERLDGLYKQFLICYLRVASLGVRG